MITLKKYSYNIRDQADETLFYKQCDALEKNIPNIRKIDFRQDVDSSIIQIYEVGNQKIEVYNDTNVGAIYIKSEIDLEQLFN